MLRVVHDGIDHFEASYRLVSHGLKDVLYPVLRDLAHQGDNCTVSVREPLNGALSVKRTRYVT